MAVFEGSNDSYTPPTRSSMSADAIPADSVNNENKPKLLRKAVHLISEDEYLSMTSEEERNIIRFEMNCATLHFLDLDRPVYLEKLGIIYPEVSERSKTHILGEWCMVRNETLRTFHFEKCDDTIALPSNVMSSLVQTRELADRIYPRLPLPLQMKWSMADLRVFLRVFVNSLKHRIVRTGHASMLSTVGDFYALHNRQGSSVSEWYAGADIFIKGRRHLPITVGKPTIFRRPELADAWELLQAAYGKPIKRYKVPVSSILQDLGYAYEGSAEQSDNQEVIDVAVFSDKATITGKGSTNLIYCTNGLRLLGLSTEKHGRVGNEIVFQTPMQDELDMPEEIPALPAQALVMGWILMHGTKSKTIKPGVGLSSKEALGGNSKLHAVLVTKFARVRREQLSTEGPFSYMNIVGITADEADFIKRHQRSHLLAALEARGLDQITHPNRSSVFARTEIELPMALAS